MITGGKNYWQEDSGDYQNSPWTAMWNGSASPGTTQQSVSAVPSPTPTAPTPSGMATTQIGRTTAPQTGTTATTNPWTDVGLSFDGNRVQLPTISRSDFEWRDAVAPTWQQGDGGDYGQPSQWVGGSTGGWRLTDAARARLGDMWTKDDQTSVAWNFAGPDTGQGASSFFGGGGMNQDLGYQNYTMGENGQRMKWVADPNSSGDNASGSWQVDEGPGTISGDRDWLDKFFSQDRIHAAIKTADKKGTGVGWRRQGDSFVGAGKSNEFDWDTNPDHTQAALMFAALLSMGLAAPAAAGAAAASGGAGAAGAGAAASAGAAGAAGATAGGVLGTGLTLAEIGQGISLMNFASGGQIPGLREAGLVSGIASGVGGIANGFSSGVNSMSDAFNLAKSGYSVYNKGTNLYESLTGGNERPSNMTTLNKFGQPMTPPQRDPDMMYAGGTPGFYAPGGGGYNGGRSPYQTDVPVSNFFQGGGGTEQAGATGGGGDMNWLDTILRLGAGGFSEHQNRDSFKGLNDLASRVEQQRQPYIDKLRQSYDDPNSYFQGPEYQAMKRLEEDRLARGAAKTGRLSNDVDRAALLQDHAAKNIAGYRQGLTQSLGQHQLALQPFMEGMRRNANAGGAAFGGAGYGGLPGIIRSAMGGGGGAGGGAGGIADIIRRISGSGSFTPNVGGQGPSDYGQGTTFESDYPMDGPAEVSYGNFDGFNGWDNSDATMPENWNWDDSDSWDFTNWFDDGGSFWGIE